MLLIGLLVDNDMIIIGHHSFSQWMASFSGTVFIPFSPSVPT